MRHMDSLAQILDDVLECYRTEGEYFERATDAGHSLAAALDLLCARGTLDVEADCVWAGDEWHGHALEPVLGLVRYLEGDVERAQRVLDETRWLRDASARTRWDEHLAAVRARSAIELGAPAGALVASLDALSARDRERLREAAAFSLDVRRMLELARDGSPSALELLRDAAARRDPLELLGELLALEADPELALRVLPSLGDEPPPSDPALALADLHARLLLARSRPVRAAIGWIADQRTIEAWLPTLRARGLGASAAALHMVERGETPPTIARALHDAGYTDDDVLRGLLENGISRRATLRLLGEHGWSVDRMTASLLARGVLLPEVRDELAALGLGAAAIEDVLVRHADPALVQLVMRR